MFSFLQVLTFCRFFFMLEKVFGPLSTPYPILSVIQKNCSCPHGRHTFFLMVGPLREGYEQLMSRRGFPDLSGTTTKKTYFLCVFPIDWTWMCVVCIDLEVVLHRPEDLVEEGLHGQVLVPDHAKQSVVLVGIQLNKPRLTNKNVVHVRILLNKPWVSN